MQQVWQFPSGPLTITLHRGLDREQAQTVLAALSDSLPQPEEYEDGTGAVNNFGFDTRMVMAHAFEYYGMAVGAAWNSCVITTKSSGELATGTDYLYADFEVLFNLVNAQIAKLELANACRPRQN